MNLRVFYLTRRGISDGYAKAPQRPAKGNRRGQRGEMTANAITQKSPPTQYLSDIAWRGFYGLCITDCGTEAAIV